MTETAVTPLAAVHGLSSADGAQVAIVIVRVWVTNWLGKPGSLYRVTAITQKDSKGRPYKLAKNYRDLETAAQAFFQAASVVGLLGRVEYYGEDGEGLLKLLEVSHAH